MMAGSCGDASSKLSCSTPDKGTGDGIGRTCVADSDSTPTPDVQRHWGWQATGSSMTGRVTCCNNNGRITE